MQAVLRAFTMIKNNDIIKVTLHKVFLTCFVRCCLNIKREINTQMQAFFCVLLLYFTLLQKAMYDFEWRDCSCLRKLEVWDFLV